MGPGIPREPKNPEVGGGVISGNIFGLGFVVEIMKRVSNNSRHSSGVFE